MIDLGTGPAPSTLDAVTLSLDEMELVIDRLQLDELPVVLDAGVRYDNLEARDAAFAAAEQSLTERGLLEDQTINPELADWLAVLVRPHWVVALRLFVGDTISRLCLAKGDDHTVLTLRGPQSYVISTVSGDPTQPIIASLGKVNPLEFGGLNAPTEPLGEIFDDTADPALTASRLTKIGAPEQESSIIGAAMLHCFAHTSIVGVVYGDGTRDVVADNIAVFDTKDGRFVATASHAADGTKWTSLSSGTDARLRQALQELISSLPERQEFPHSSS